MTPGTKTNTNSHMLIEALLATAKRKKKVNFPSMDEQVTELWCESCFHHLKTLAET